MPCVNDTSSAGTARMSQSLVTLRHADIGYGQQPILENVSLSIGSRDFFILNGPNGGGKTTLLRVIGGLLPLQKGEENRSPDLTIGYLPQYRGIDRQFPITVEEVVRSGLAGRKPAWKGYGKHFRALAEDMMARMHIDELKKRSIDALSGGQWQRTLLARALVGSPSLLLLDEPDTHLDAETKDWLYTTIGQESGQRAIVIVSHDRYLPERFPDCKIIYVENGHMA